MKRQLLLLQFTLCSVLAGHAGAQVLFEDFDGPIWPPAGWTVVDNLGNGSWDLSSSYNRGNLTHGSGECAVIDSDYWGSGVNIDGELISPAFVIPSAGYHLEFEHDLNYLSGEVCDVDISVSGGAWTNLETYTQDETQLRSIDLTPHAGASVQIRFHYYLANYDWWWHIDDVNVFIPPPPPTAIWIEDFDSGTWPPTGWTVIDTLGSGTWDLSSAFSHGNTSGGSGECAAFDSDNYGTINVAGELITMPFNVPSTGCLLEYSHNFDHLGPEFGDVDIRIGGGAWVNLVSYNTDTSGRESIDLGAWAGMANAEIRFNYYNANYEWYWHLDDVGLYSNTGPGTPYCLGDGVQVMCPCANNNNGGMGGCDWGDPLFRSGGALTATGSASVLSGNTFLVAAGVDNSFGIFFQADNQINGGDGAMLNDGLRCAGGHLVRLTAPIPATGNTMAMASTLQAVGTALAGTTKRYQYWFLTPNGPCGTGANLTNGYEIVWGP